MPESSPSGRDRNRILNNPFMIFLLGQIVMFIFWVGGASYFSGQFTQRFANLEARVQAVEIQNQRQDEQGTNASRLTTTLEQNRITELETRLKYYEELSRKLPVIESTLTRIESDVKELKTKK